MEQLALSLPIAFAIAALFRTPGACSPALAGAEAAPNWPGRLPSDEEEQLPETDRAPSRWLGWTVAGLATVRVGLLVAMHA